MSPISRRHLLRAAPLGLPVASLARSPAFAAASFGAPTAAKRPRMFVQFATFGGMDAVLTTDPKERGEVDEDVDVPYTPDRILAVQGRRFGPLMAGWGEQLATTSVVNGVQCGTASHHTGSTQLVYLRRNTRDRRIGNIGLTGTIGRLTRETFPLENIWMVMGQLDNQHLYPAGRSLVLDSWLFPETQLSSLVKLANERSRRSAYVQLLERELARCRFAEGCMPLQASARLLDALAGKELGPPVRVKNPDFAHGNATLLANGMKGWERLIRDLVFTLKHRLAPAIFVAPPLVFFDTHVDNLRGQTLAMACFAAGFTAFLEALRKTKNSEGQPLADEVGVVICSEVGRFPVLNSYRGKDHFPEHPVIFIGPGIRPGTYGQTNQKMVSVPVGLATGRPDAKRSVIPTLDDVGTTCLHWMGLEDTASVGYLGRPLRFLLG